MGKHDSLRFSLGSAGEDDRGKILILALRDLLSTNWGSFRANAAPSAITSPYERMLIEADRGNSSVTWWTVSMMIRVSQAGEVVGEVEDFPCLFRILRETNLAFGHLEDELQFIGHRIPAARHNGGSSERMARSAATIPCGCH